MNSPVAPSRASKAVPMTPAEQWIDANADGVETREERSVGTAGEAQLFTHTGAILRIMYFPTTWGWESREIPSTNVKACAAIGARYNCGDCNGDCSPDPMNPQYNNCPGREKFATRQCIVCGKLVYDFGARSVNADLLATAEVNESRVNDAAGTLIQDDAYNLTLNPATRTKADLDRHIAAYHPTQAAAMGINRSILGPTAPGTGDRA